MPMCPEAAIAMLACALIGAIHSVVFGGFSSESIKDRINDSKAKMVITADGGYRRGAIVPLKRNVDEALKGDEQVERVIVFRRAADIGWVTGHSYTVYGPLCIGATVLMYEGAPNWPEPDRFWHLIEQHRFDVLYTAPTAIRAFIRWGDEYRNRHDLSSLRLLGTLANQLVRQHPIA
jgi:acetyl-CoA synthetase